MATEPDPDIVEEVRARAGPIEDHLYALGTAREWPLVPLGVCTILIDESGPPLRALLERAAAGEALGDEQAQLLFCGVHILGGGRDTLACTPLLRLLRRPEDEVEDLLGDAVTENLPRIVAGVYDGDWDALVAAIVDPDAGEYVRDALIGAATFLAWEGRVDKAAMTAFLERFFHERLAPDGDFAWYGWQQAVALLGLRSLEPLVRRAFDEERIPIEMLEFDDFKTELAAAERAPDDIARFHGDNLGYIEDVADALCGYRWGNDDDTVDWGAAEAAELVEAEESDRGWSEPAFNPWRNVGRNDPCPCGSGRKFKKCCLGSDGEEP